MCTNYLCHLANIVDMLCGIGLFGGGGHGRPQEFFQGGGEPLGGPPKICEGGPPYFS